MVGCGFLFFFFQAEDGIRDLTVTGVQTCALPISGHPERRHVIGARQHARGTVGDTRPVRAHVRALVVKELVVEPENAAFGVDGGSYRSEERRVGKECRSRWSRYHYKTTSDESGNA